MKKLILFCTIMLFSLTFTQAFNFESGGVRIIEPIDSNANVLVNIQDQITPPIDLFFAKGDGVPSFLSTQTQIDNRSISVVNPVSFTVGNYIIIAEEDRFYTGELLAINGNVLSLDTPLDFNFSTSGVVVPSTRDLNVDGSITPQVFSIRAGATSGLSLGISRLMIHMETAGQVDLNKFGDLTALTNGIVVRRVDGTTRNIFNVKTNGEMRNLCFDWTADIASNPSQGQNGVGFRYTFAGQDKHGVAVRLDPGDELQIIIQDDLTGLDKFRIIAEGHEVLNQ